jgi:hypothetical protein
MVENQLPPAVPEEEKEHSAKKVDKRKTPGSIRKKYKPRTPKFAVNCEHKDLRSYALGLCKNCYHSRGRTKLATDCPHSDRKLYAHNVCKGCYLRLFCRKKESSLKK